MTRPPADRPALSRVATAPTPTSPDPVPSRASGLTREAFALHGSRRNPQPAVGRVGRPATAQRDRTEDAGESVRSLRPRSHGAHIAPPNARTAGPQLGGAAKTDAASQVPNSRLKASAAWLEAAKAYPFARGILQPLQVTGSLLSGDNVVHTNLHVLAHPEHNERWLVTEYDARVESTAKCRRWAMSDRGTFACVLEWLPFYERPLGAPYADYPAQERQQLTEMARQAERTRRLSPRERRVRDNEAAQLEAEVIREVQTASLLNRELEVFAFFRTADGRLVAMMTDFPEEMAFMALQLTAEQRRYTAMRFFAEVATHMDQGLHRKGLVHGDFKPANAMMANNGAICLIDFEHTRLLDGTGLVPRDECQPPTFAPPEYDAHKQMGKAGDLWALGRSVVSMCAHGDSANRAQALLNDPEAYAAAEDAFVANERNFERALKRGDFERVRASLAAAEDPVAQLAIAQKQHPYLAFLEPLAKEVPEVFTLVVRSLLAKDPALRRDATEARALGQKLVALHGPEIAANRTVEQAVLAASLSREQVEPVLRIIGGEDNFFVG